MRKQKSVAVVCLVCAWLLGLGVALAQQPERLVAPTVPANPSQADEGALVYYYLCMTCHGERGQGLTEEFREAWAPEDQNCWQAKCHGSLHPPDGFELVTYVPPVIGDRVLAKSLNAQQLHSYISQTMPWQNPGGLTDEETWQVTAFLLRENGVDYGDLPLGSQQATALPEETPPGGSTTVALASATPPHVPVTSPALEPVELAALIALAVVAVLVAVWLVRRRARQKQR